MSQKKEIVDLSLKELESHYSKFLSEVFLNKKFITFWEPDPDYKDLEDDEYLKQKKQCNDMIPLSIGMPNPGFFPIKSIDLNILDHPFDNKKISSADSISTITKDLPTELNLPKILQYGDTRGLSPLLKFVNEFIIKLGNSPMYNNWDSILTSGSSDSLYKVFEVLCDQNTTVMTEELTFTPILSCVYGSGGNVVPIKMNVDTVSKDNYGQDINEASIEHQGIDVDYMSDLLDNWEKGQYKHLPKPTLLYTVTTGQNPTGVSSMHNKKKQIYKLAQKHDFIIVEDDPYGYLRLPQFNKSNPMDNLYEDPKFNINKYIDDILIKSYLSMDTDGRVLRLETFSKLFAPGLRLSFIAGNKYLINKILYHQEISTRAASSLSQSIVYSTIKTLAERDQTSMSESWINWVIKVASKYTERRNFMLQKTYEVESFKKGYLNVVEPSAGMFINFKINFNSLKQNENDKIDVIKQMNILEKYFIKNGVAVVLGYKMAIDREVSKENCSLIRTTISFANEPEQLVEAVRRIDISLMEFFEKRFM